MYTPSNNEQTGQACSVVECVEEQTDANSMKDEEDH